ncbi:MAG: CYTH domain-containing protein [Bacteroidota bacterium]
MIEIERKFLVNSKAFKAEAFFYERIVQGFLNTHPERTVRVRIKGDMGFLTVKGKSNKEGTSRFEWEKEIKVSEAQALLALCEHGIVDKVRYSINVKNHIFEVDEFFGENKGLIIAEIELEREDEKFERPQWLGNEVTGEIKYYNSQISKQPYKNWKK